MLLTLSIFLCCVALLCSCEGHSIEPPAEIYDVTFVLDSGGAGRSRATAVADETSLREMCLYVFDVRGEFVDVISSTTASAAGNYTEGYYTVYALVNCGADATDFATQAEIGSARLSLTSQSSAFSMYGCTSFAVSENATCQIPVARLVSKVEIRKVSADFSSRPGLAGATLTIDAIYVINATGMTVLDEAEDYTPDVWFNKRGYIPGGADVLLYDEVDAAIPDGSSYDTSHCYYCFQNGCVDDSRSPDWSPRHTRLVLDCTLAGRKTYYPIDIISPEGYLVRNCNYRINELTITGYGADGPDEPVIDADPYYYSAIVADWEGSYTISEDF